MTLRGQSTIVYAVWGTLVFATLVALATARWSVAFVSLLTLLLSMLPAIFVERFQIRLPVSFFAGIVLFVFATIFLGEAFDFYERYWWWDVLLHGGSAVGFGLIGFLYVFMLFEGDRYAAPPIAVAFVAYCFAVTIGASWEIFEFATDQIFGTTMQKSGLIDTMWDLIVDAIGAAIGAWSGFLYLKGREFGELSDIIDQFVHLNRRFFRKFRERNEPKDGG
ncbi:MAG: hypothetical protein ACE5FS_15750 [Paracoccaceae bacterium]